MATRPQRIAIALALLTAAFSLVAAGVGYYRTGEVNVTRLAGGLFMLALGVAGLMRLRRIRP
jgi:hypothetical protein